MALKSLKKWVYLLLALAVVYTAVVLVCIVRNASRDESRRDGAIVVFGASEYNGCP